MSKATRFTTRAEIRKKVCEILVDNVDVKERVFANRVRPISISQLPLILVYPKSEDYTVLNKVPRIHRVDLSLIIEVVGTANTEELLSELLDELAEQIEDALDNSDNLGKLVHDINIDTAESGLEGGESQRPEFSWIMTFNVAYIRKPK